MHNKIPVWKRVLQNVTLFSVLALLAGSCLALALDLDRSGSVWIKLLKYCIVVVAGWGMIHLALYLHAHHIAAQVKITKQLKHFYVNRTKFNWKKFKKWQRVEMAKHLIAWGFKTREELESLHSNLPDWMKRERFWLVSYAALYAEIGLPKWSAFLSSVFDKDVKALDERLLLMLLLTLIVIVGCAGIRMSSEIITESFPGIHRFPMCVICSMR